jgi:hypothetical protein
MRQTVVRLHPCTSARVCWKTVSEERKMAPGEGHWDRRKDDEGPDPVAHFARLELMRLPTTSVPYAPSSPTSPAGVIPRSRW